MAEKCRVDVNKFETGQINLVFICFPYVYMQFVAHITEERRLGP